MKLLRWILFAAAPAVLFADPAAGARPDVVQRYVRAVQAQQSQSKAPTLEVEIDAKVPRLKKEGRLRALRFISDLGRITYRILKFEGDNTVKKDVIARYLTAEQQAKAAYAASLSITPENYRFRYKGVRDYAGKKAYVFEVSPIKKRVGLYEGELWIDAATYLPLREWGELVRTPSVFLKNVYFVRDYFIQDGQSVPRRIISNVDTRIVGKVQLTIWFEPVSGDSQVQLSSLLAAGALGNGEGVETK